MEGRFLAIHIFLGGYYYDSAVMFNATFIVEKYASDGVVFVVPAYRLGLFGFLDLGDDNVVTRNLGLHGAFSPKLPDRF